MTTRSSKNNKNETIRFSSIKSFKPRYFFILY